jgi:hypothetical protein
MGAQAFETRRLIGIIDADQVAACVRAIMAERSSWTGGAADLLGLGAGSSNGTLGQYRRRLSEKAAATDLVAWPAH